jgi:hypothetical protein
MGSSIDGTALRNALAMHQAANTARDQFLEAFMAQTGLTPDQATLCYGTRMEGENKVFRVYYIKNEVMDELQQLRDLAVKVSKGEDCQDEARNLVLTNSYNYPAPEAPAIKG